MSSTHLVSSHGVFLFLFFRSGLDLDCSLAPTATLNPFFALNMLATRIRHGCRFISF
eukprot:m.122563 g.122563  ORF g.122563 m.122563 type:complete len:57 (-) comp9631_c2_seq1:370-540(-)